MNNKNLLIALGVGVVVYYFYNKNQKEKLQSTPYTDAELDKVASDFINKQLSFAKIVEPNKEPIDFEKGKKEVLDMIKKASLNGKDVSRANIDKILAIYDKSVRNMYGDKSMGIATPEEMNLFYDFRNVNVPIQNSQGFFPNIPVNPQNNQPNNLGLTKEQCEKAGKKYTQVELHCIAPPCGGGFGICE